MKEKEYALHFSFLKQKQSLSLEAKIQMSLERIRQWYDYYDGQVYVSFSGGKDSQVLLHLVRSVFPDVEGIFINTGMEFPDILNHVKKFDNITWVKPKMTFWQVIQKYGWPAISKENAQKIYEINTTKSEKLRNLRLYGRNGTPSAKLPNRYHSLIGEKISHLCCDKLKKGPIILYEKNNKKPFLGIMASEGGLRKFRKQCNIIDAKKPSSAPLFFWLEKDIWEYARRNNLVFAPPYYSGEARTGCMFCLFGAHHNDFARIKSIQEKYPALYKVFLKYGGMEMIEKIKECFKKR